MFYYLRAKNVNLSKNMEQVVTSTAIKYISLFLFVKLIEYKYFEPNFFNMFMYSFVICDVLFSLMLHYKLYSKENDSVFWDDDIMDPDPSFNLSEYKSEYKMAKKEIELNHKHGTCHKHINLNDDDLKADEVEEITDEFHTDDLEKAINHIISDSKKDNSDIKLNNDIIDKESISVNEEEINID